MRNRINSELSDDSGGSQVARILLQYQKRLASMRALFLYEKSALDITVINLRALESELRNMVGGIEKFRCIPDVRRLLSSPDAAQEKLVCVIKYLNRASDRLEMSKTPKNRDEFYDLYYEIPNLLDQAIERLKPSLNHSE